MSCPLSFGHPPLSFMSTDTTTRGSPATSNAARRTELRCSNPPHQPVAKVVDDERRHDAISTPSVSKLATVSHAVVALEVTHLVRDDRLEPRRGHQLDEPVCTTRRVPSPYRRVYASVASSDGCTAAAGRCRARQQRRGRACARGGALGPTRTDVLICSSTSICSATGVTRDFVIGSDPDRLEQLRVLLVERVPKVPGADLLRLARGRRGGRGRVRRRRVARVARRLRRGVLADGPRERGEARVVEREGISPPRARRAPRSATTTTTTAFRASRCRAPVHEREHRVRLSRCSPWGGGGTARGPA